MKLVPEYLLLCRGTAVIGLVGSVHVREMPPTLLLDQPRWNVYIDRLQTLRNLPPLELGEMVNLYARKDNEEPVLFAADLLCFDIKYTFGAFYDDSRYYEGVVFETLTPPACMAIQVGQPDGT